MKIPGFAIDAYAKATSLPPLSEPPIQIAKNDKGFDSVFKDALGEVNGLQKDAEKKVKDMVLGKTNSPHEAMIALEKADAAFQLMNQVRTKIVRAYEEVVRTQI